jgi:hypothetical protein
MLLLALLAVVTACEGRQTPVSTSATKGDDRGPVDERPPNGAAPSDETATIPQPAKAASAPATAPSLRMPASSFGWLTASMPEDLSITLVNSGRRGSAVTLTASAPRQLAAGDLGTRTRRVRVSKSELRRLWSALPHDAIKKLLAQPPSLLRTVPHDASRSWVKITGRGEELRVPDDKYVPVPWEILQWIAQIKRHVPPIRKPPQQPATSRKHRSAGTTLENPYQ